MNEIIEQKEENFIDMVCSRYGLTRRKLADELDIPLRTVENWSYRNTCPIYVRNMIIDTLEYRQIGK